MTELELLLTTIERMRNVYGCDDSVMDWLRNRTVIDTTPLEMVSNKQTRLMYQIVLWDHGGKEH